MTGFIAALPMYDWPEARADTDAEWRGLRARLRSAGIEAPETLVRRNADMPPVPGGIVGLDGTVIAPDPATLPPDELDFPTLWKHPDLLFAQTCWGPMEQGLERHVSVIGQPSYDGMEGGHGEFYSSPILMRKGSAPPASAPADGRAMLPLELVANRRFAYNGTDSMSGMIALSRDLQEAGRDLSIFSGHLETGAHRASIVAVAEGRADVCAVDCRSWHLAKRYEPCAGDVAVVGWTAHRKGLPYITSRRAKPELVERLRGALR